MYTHARLGACSSGIVLVRFAGHSSASSRIYKRAVSPATDSITKLFVLERWLLLSQIKLYVAFVRSKSLRAVLGKTIHQSWQSGARRIPSLARHRQHSAAVVIHWSVTLLTMSPDARDGGGRTQNRLLRAPASENLLPNTMDDI